MNQPFYFGRSPRRLFGVYAPPSARPTNRGVVLCYPWGQEYLRAHRSFRVLADSMAGKGFHVLRFDYFGTGDSAGEGRDVEFAGLQADTAVAVAELKGISGIRRVGLLGLRLGAPVAAAVASRDPQVRKVALWDPVVDGTEYLNELDRLAGVTRDEGGSTAHPAVAGRDGGAEVDGFPLTASLRGNLRGIRLDEEAGTFQPGVLLAVTEETDTVRRLRSTLEEHPNSAFSYAFRPGPRAWQQEHDFGAGAVPSAVIECLASWDW